MKNKSQSEAFIGSEADAWFERNFSYIQAYNPENDSVINLLKEYSIRPNNLLEVGCSGGYRLGGLKTLYPDCSLFGVEPSTKAINYGKTNFPEITLVQGTADNLQDFSSGSMDVVIVGFVFYVIDRSNLLKVVSEIDRVLNDKGFLIILDFYSARPLRNPYHHITNTEAYSYKQNYEEIFTSSKLYQLLDKGSLCHEKQRKDSSDDFANKLSISLLKKDIFASYR